MLQRCCAGHARRLSLVILTASLGLGAVARQSQASDGAADALLAIDQHRASVVERIVDTWGAALAKSNAQVSVDELRTLLEGLRVDHLLAASLAGTVDGLRDVLAKAVMAPAAVKPWLRQVKALGDTTIDDVYSPVTPCRLVETRGNFPAVYQGDGTLSLPLPFASNEIRSYTVQGGNGVCLSQLPAGLNPSAVQLQVFAMPTTANSGDLEILPQGAAFGSTATMVYVSNLQFNTVSTAAKINTANDQISVQVRGGGANVAIDVVGYFKSAADATAMNFNVNGERVMRYEFKPESPNVIGGSPSNIAGAFYAQTIAGGGLAGETCYDPPSGTFTRHCGNSAANVLATVGGGAANVASGEQSTVAGGIKNTASGLSGTVGGGQENTASNSDATIAGGAENTASGFDATVAGGEHNVASGFGATVLGGEFNTAQGQFSVAMGAQATAFHDYSVVWNGWSSGISAGSFRPHVFQVHADNGLDVEYGAPRADGGGTSWVWISNGIAGQAIATSTGGFLSTGGVWTNNSDRARKADLRPVDPQTILDKVVRLPVSSWQYTAEDAEVRHVGPMAQDFYAAFGLGPSEKSIATVDAEGIALAAIQGLHQLVHEKDAKIEAQKREIADLRDRLLQVENTLLRLTTGDGRVAMHPTP